MKKLMFLVVFLASASGFCSETAIMWTKLQVNRTYRDADVNCFGVTGEGQLLISAEIKDGRVVAAQLQNYPNVFPYTAIYAFRPLSDSETQSLKLFKDKRGTWWLTRLELSESTFRWALYESAKRYAFCHAPQPLETVTPKGFVFEFETEGLEEGIWLSESNRTDVSGTRKDGGAYKGSIQITQREFKDGL